MLVLFMSLKPGSANAMIPDYYPPVSRAGMVSLWSVKLSSDTTIGGVWDGMPSYQWVCKSQKVVFPNNETLYRILFYPNFYGPDTFVSKDIQCELTNTWKGSKFFERWLQEPSLYREISSNQFEPHRDLIYADQVRSFDTSNPNLVCKAIGVGVDSWETGRSYRYHKVIFKPFVSPNQWLGGFLYASRDLSCTTDVVQINKWKRNRYWTFIKLP
jgi:hypothetical protein